MELFVNKFSKNCKKMSGDELHTLLDQIHEIHGFYSPPFLGLAAAVACSAFTFLLGGGPIEMFCAFLGAGNFLRAKMNQHHLTLFLCTAASVALACIVYTIAFMALKSGFHISIHHQAGYICSMLFIIPGFPFITSGIDLAKLDMRSGLDHCCCNFSCMDACFSSSFKTDGFSSIEFKQVRIPDISTDRKLFWSFRFLRNV